MPLGLAVRFSPSHWKKVDSFGALPEPVICPLRASLASMPSRHATVQPGDRPRRIAAGLRYKAFFWDNLTDFGRRGDISPPIRGMLGLGALPVGVDSNRIWEVSSVARALLGTGIERA